MSGTAPPAAPPAAGTALRADIDTGGGAGVPAFGDRRTGVRGAAAGVADHRTGTGRPVHRRTRGVARGMRSTGSRFRCRGTCWRRSATCGGDRVARSRWGNDAMDRDTLDSEAEASDSTEGAAPADAAAGSAQPVHRGGSGGPLAVQHSGEISDRGGRGCGAGRLPADHADRLAPVSVFGPVTAVEREGRVV